MQRKAAFVRCLEETMADVDKTDTTQTDPVLEEWAARRAQRPGFVEALMQDAMAYAANRGERKGLDSKQSRWRYAAGLLWRSDTYLGLVLYRIRMALHDRGIPILPRLIHIFCSVVYGLSIDDYVVLKAGIYLPHGQTELGGITLIGSGCVLGPWSGIGLVQGNLLGPNIGDNVLVGTGANILGNLTIGDGARIGASALVLSDVPAGATAVGVPAKIRGVVEGS